MCLEIQGTTDSRRLTSARLDPLGPCVIKLCVASISTGLEPSTTASTTAGFAGFLASTAHGAFATTRHCGGFCGHASVNMRQ